MSNTLTRTEVLNASGGILTESALKRLLKDAQQSAVLGGKPENVVLNAIMKAVQNHRLGQKLTAEPETVAAMGNKSAMWDRKVPAELLGGKAAKAEAFALEIGHVENAFRGHKATTIFSAATAGKGRIPASSQRIIDEHFKSLPGFTPPTKKQPAWKTMSAGDQITTGICFLTAASFLLSGAARAQAAFTKDEEGKRSVNPTTLTIAMGEMAAGIAAGIFGAHIYRGATR